MSLPRPLDVSLAVVALFIEQRRSDFSVKELAEHAGVSERTFYRHFARKEESILPYLHHEFQRLVAAVAERPRTEPLQTAIARAYAAAWKGAPFEDWRVLSDVLAADDAMLAVWMQAWCEGERRLSDVFADRLGLEAGSMRASLLGALVVTTGRVTLGKAGSSSRPAPATVFAKNLALLGAELFEPAR